MHTLKGKRKLKKRASKIYGTVSILYKNIYVWIYQNKNAGIITSQRMNDFFQCECWGTNEWMKYCIQVSSKRQDTMESRENKRKASKYCVHLYQILEYHM